MFLSGLVARQKKVQKVKPSGQPSISVVLFAAKIDIRMERVFKRVWYRKVVTFGVTGIVFAVCLSSFALSQQGSKKARADQKTDTYLAMQVSASPALVTLPPKWPEVPVQNCELTGNEVRLYANTTSPDKDNVNLKWQVPVGRLITKKRAVIWDLSGVEDGTYTATVEASDRHKNTGSGSVTVTVLICPGVFPDPPPCPTISVSCPSEVEAKDAVTFEATVSGGPPDVTPTYQWSVTAGKIISGQGTPKITVDVSTLNHKGVTATVKVGGMDRACSTVASCSVQVGSLR